MRPTGRQECFSFVSIFLRVVSSPRPCHTWVQDLVLVADSLLRTAQAALATLAEQMLSRRVVSSSVFVASFPRASLVFAHGPWPMPTLGDVSEGFAVRAQGRTSTFGFVGARVSLEEVIRGPSHSALQSDDIYSCIDLEPRTRAPKPSESHGTSSALVFVSCSLVVKFSHRSGVGDARRDPSPRTTTMLAGTLCRHSVLALARHLAPRCEARELPLRARSEGLF